MSTVASPRQDEQNVFDSHIQCECGMPVKIEPPQATWYNDARVSLVIVNHENPFVCQCCGNRFTFQVVKERSGLACDVIKLKRPKSENLIIMPGPVRGI